MGKKAVCVGINDYPIQGADLKGCVNDANGWASVLADHFGFPRADIRLITDAEATQSEMLTALKDLVAGARSGDVIVFTNSSHGSYIVDEDDDEPDHYDEIICPYDVRHNALVDDQLREVLSAVPSDVHATVISDSCHSGNVTRVIVPGVDGGERRIRFLNPARFRRTLVLDDALGTPAHRRIAYPESGMHHLLLSGCKDSEVSYDAHIGGGFHGAMTYHALLAIKQANYRLTYADLETQLQSLLTAAHFDQHPQLEGPSAAKQRQLFT